MRIFLFLIFFICTQVKAQTVLVVGDSHSVGPFGRKLDSLLREKYPVATFASCGSIAQWWFSGKATTCGFFSRNLDGKETDINKSPTPLIRRLLKDIHPQIVILELGANYFGYPSDEFVKNDLSNLVNEILNSHAQCLIVTSPDSRYKPEQLPRLLKLTHETVGDKCLVFESDKVTKYPATGGDGIHYWSVAGTPIAHAWAEKVFQFFEQNY